MPIIQFEITLDSFTDIAEGIRHFYFKRNDNEQLEFTPGQFIDIHFEIDGEEFKRSYSVATVQGQSEFIEFAASYIEKGPASEMLFNLQIGDTLTASGPYGRLILLDPDPKRYIFVATGTGITPYRAMTAYLNERLRKREIEVELVQGVRIRDDLIYKNEFVEFDNQHENFHYHAQYSRESDDSLKDRQTFENLGYVQKKLESLNLNPEEDVVYLCGNPEMIDQCFEYLKEVGFTPKNVKREKYISKEIRKKVT